MAISDKGTKLYAKDVTGDKYTQLVKITSAPATGSAPKTLDTTCLDDEYTTSIPDRPETPLYEFEYNYTAEDFEKVMAAISATEDKDYLIVYSDGSGEAFTGRGNTWVKDISVGKVVKAGLAFAVSWHEHKTESEVSAMISVSA